MKKYQLLLRLDMTSEHHFKCPLGLESNQLDMCITSHHIISRRICRIQTAIRFRWIQLFYEDPSHCYEKNRIRSDFIDSREITALITNQDEILGGGVISVFRWKLSCSSFFIEKKRKRKEKKNDVGTRLASHCQ